MSNLNLTPKAGDYIQYHGIDNTVVGGIIAERAISPITGNQRYRVVDSLREAPDREAGRWIGLEETIAVFDYEPGVPPDDAPISKPYPRAVHNDDGTLQGTWVAPGQYVPAPALKIELTITEDEYRHVLDALHDAARDAEATFGEHSQRSIALWKIVRQFAKSID